MRLSSALLTLPLLIACEAPRDRVQPEKKIPPPVTIQQTSSLRTQLNREDVQVVGISIDPITNARYVLDTQNGILELKNGTFEVVAGPGQLVPWDVPLASQYTDLASLGNGKFALTAANDGFLLDLEEGTLRQHFCYVPGELIGEVAPAPVTQLTRSLTYDKFSNRLYAQPQTFINDITGEVFRSSIGQFELSGGEGFGWIELDDLDFLAGGIAILEDGSMLLGRGRNLHTFSMDNAKFEDSIDLTPYGITAIDAMVYDHENQQLLVVDAMTDELVEITLNR